MTIVRHSCFSIYCKTIFIKYIPCLNWSHIHDNYLNFSGKILWTPVRPIYNTPKLRTSSISSRVVSKLLIYDISGIIYFSYLTKLPCPVAQLYSILKKWYERSHLVDSKYARWFSTILKARYLYLKLFGAFRQRWYRFACQTQNVVPMFSYAWRRFVVLSNESVSSYTRR